jgi:NAD(P)-dependent dehydrogenase (short-subunit alcohol dehydrogenase family)
MIDLKGHTALVTGSTSGVGRAIALAYARAGAAVVIHGPPGATAEGRRVADECRRAKSEAAFVACDLLDPPHETAEQLFQLATAAFGAIDILVNNAGHFLDVPFEKMTPDRFDRTMRLNVAAPYFLTQRFVRHWLAKDVRGRVIFTGSINGRLAESDSTAYDTSKGAIEMLVKTLCVSLAPKGIRVNGIAPGLVRTNATRWLDSNPQEAKWIKEHTPDGQIPDAAVCGPAAVYLASDAADHVHGQMLLVDGGLSALQHPRRTKPLAEKLIKAGKRALRDDS